MIEVAIVSMEQALEADGEPLPAGSGTLPRESLPPPGAGAKVGAGTLGKQEAEAVAPVTIDPPLPGV
jgi:hypothetical protein